MCIRDRTQAVLALGETADVAPDAQVEDLRVGASAAGHQVDLREHLEVPDRRQDRDDREDRFEHRHGDAPEPPPRAGAVDGGGLVELLGHRQQAGQHGHRDEREAVMDDVEPGDGEEAEPVEEPVDLARLDNPEGTQQVGHQLSLIHISMCIRDRSAWLSTRVEPCPG